MKIVSTGGTISTETYLARRRVARRKRQIFVSASLLILLVLLVVISRLERFRIQDISVTGANVIGADTVTEFTQNILSGYYLWLIPHNNALIYPRGELKRALANNFPRFSSVNVALSGLNKLNVTVVEREPFALYCSAVDATEISPCYFLDNSGFIFDSAPAFSGGVYFVYASLETIDNPLGRQLLPQDQFQMLVKFIDKLPELGVIPLTLKLNEGYFELTLPHDAHLLWSRDSDFTLIYSNLEVFLKSETIISQKDFLSKVSELDLRTDNKVFYTFK